MLPASPLRMHKTRLLEHKASNQAAQPEQQAQEFSANLTGDSEVPPVTTNATGSAEFELNDDADEMTYDLEVEEIEGVLFAHIHQVAIARMDP